MRITNRIESIRIANWNALVRMPTPVANFPPVSSGDSVGLWPVKHDAYCYARSRCLAAVVLKTRMLLLWWYLLVWAMAMFKFRQSTLFPLVICLSTSSILVAIRIYGLKVRHNHQRNPLLGFCIECREHERLLSKCQYTHYLQLKRKNIIIVKQLLLPRGERTRSRAVADPEILKRGAGGIRCLSPVVSYRKWT